jgi:hypothetical protein
VGLDFTESEQMFLHIEYHSGCGMTLEVAHVDHQMFVEIEQQLTWIGSALRDSSSGASVVSAKLSIAPHMSYTGPYMVPLVRMSFHEVPLPVNDAPCWLPLFSGAVLASGGFPIPDRGDEMGLEISLELLAALTGVCHAVEYQGGVVMKGFSHMLVPVRRQKDRVQWHLISSKTGSRLTYSEALSRCDARASLQEVSLDDLKTCRAILGWCSVATSRLGAVSVDYVNLDYSGAKEADASFLCAGGQLGFQQFGTAVLDFKFGAKDGRCHFQRNGPYRRVISAAEKTHVALYDTEDQRAWLVNAADVLLHMIQQRHQLDPYSIDRPSIFDPTSNTKDFTSAKEVLLQNEGLLLIKGGTYKFGEAILSIWSMLEFLVDQNASRDRNAQGLPLRGTLRDFITGFEFRAVVEERSPFRLKEVEVQKSNGGWPRLVHDIDALVLLANGFGDLLLPTPGAKAGLCRTWHSVPTGNDYLATTTKTLDDLHNIAGCRVSRKYLTSSRLRWHKGDSLLFEPCGAGRDCQCNRLQQVLPENAVGTIVPPMRFADDGAAIFGTSRTMFQKFKSRKSEVVANAIGLYSQPNSTLEPLPNKAGSRQLNPSSNASSSTAIVSTTPDNPSVPIARPPKPLLVEVGMPCDVQSLPLMPLMDLHIKSEQDKIAEIGGLQKFDSRSNAKFLEASPRYSSWPDEAQLCDNESHASCAEYKFLDTAAFSYHLQARAESIKEERSMPGVHNELRTRFKLGVDEPSPQKHHEAPISGGNELAPSVSRRTLRRRPGF